MDDSSVQLVKGSGTVLLYDNKPPGPGYYQPETRDRNSLQRAVDGTWIETQLDGLMLIYCLPTPGGGSGSAGPGSAGSSGPSGSGPASGSSGSSGSSSGSSSGPAPVSCICTCNCCGNGTPQNWILNIPGGMWGNCTNSSIPTQNVVLKYQNACLWQSDCLNNGWIWVLSCAGSAWTLKVWYDASCSGDVITWFTYPTIAIPNFNCLGSNTFSGCQTGIGNHCGCPSNPATVSPQGSVPVDGKCCICAACQPSTSSAISMTLSTPFCGLTSVSLPYNMAHGYWDSGTVNCADGSGNTAEFRLQCSSGQLLLTMYCNGAQLISPAAPYTVNCSAKTATYLVAAGTSACATGWNGRITITWS
jgi:hypothetical protein